MYVERAGFDLLTFAEVYACHFSARSRYHGLGSFNSVGRGNDIGDILLALRSFYLAEYLTSGAFFLFELRRSVHILAIGSLLAVGIGSFFALTAFLFLFLTFSLAGSCGI